MAAVAVVAPLPVIRTPETWQYGDPSLTDLRLSLLDRGQSEGVTRRKRTGSSRNRHSWRWSWKQMLTKPFQNQTWTRGGNLREKGNRKKRKSESQNVSKNPVETRKKMDELYRIWLCDANESSEESSDDELSERDRRRSCYPRIFNSDTSSSDSDTDSEEGHQVSQYVREGPSRIKVDTVRQERINEDIGTISDTSSQTSDTSDSASEVLIQIPKRGTVNHLVDMNDPNPNECEVENKRDNYKEQCSVITQPIETESSDEWEVVEIKRNTEPHLSIVTHPNTKTAHIKAIPESRKLTSILSPCFQLATEVGDGNVITHVSNTVNHGRQIITVSAQITEQNKDKAHDSTLEDGVSHDFLTSSKNSNESQEQAVCINPEAMTSTRGMINNYHNGRVISVRQIYHEDILKRVDELCAQCGTGVYGNEESKCDFYGTENGDKNEDNTKRFIVQEGAQKQHGNPYELVAPQEGWRKESSDKVGNCFLSLQHH